jgi:hypothetical protein
VRFAIVATAVVALVYTISCWWFPFAACLCCKGEGRHQRGDRKVWRLCHWCTGTGRRLRLGRRAWNAARRRRIGAR